jgi:dipeptidyl-peptidase-4
VLVPPEAGYQGFVHADPGTGWVWFEASLNPTEAHLFRAPLAGGPAVALTAETGLHRATFAKSGRLWVRQSATPRAMPRTTVHGADATKLGELPSVAEEPGFVPHTDLVKVGEGAGFWAEVIRPLNCEPSRRYPVIVDVYGGPHANVVQAGMNGWLLGQWLADQGFIVVSLDGRGTPRRGRAWERAIAGDFASVPLADQVAGLQALGRRFPELDLGRVGITGWSFGGYLAALAVLRRPDVYHAAVAGAPVTDWLDYDTHYTERYLGLPVPGGAVYPASSLLTYADQLRRPLLLVHGTSDDNVYFRHTLKLADALFRAGKDFELLPLSGLTHLVPDPVVTERLWTRTARFFRQHLIESPPRTTGWGLGSRGPRRALRTDPRRVPPASPSAPAKGTTAAPGLGHSRARCPAPAAHPGNRGVKRARGGARVGASGRPGTGRSANARAARRRRHDIGPVGPGRSIPRGRAR